MTSMTRNHSRSLFYIFFGLPGERSENSLPAAKPCIKLRDNCAYSSGSYVCFIILVLKSGEWVDSSFVAPLPTWYIYSTNAAILKQLTVN